MQRKLERLILNILLHENIQNKKKNKNSIHDTTDAVTIAMTNKWNWASHVKRSKDNVWITEIRWTTDGNKERKISLQVYRRHCRVRRPFVAQKYQQL